jgi:hypothetical protein
MMSRIEEWPRSEGRERRWRQALCRLLLPGSFKGRSQLSGQGGGGGGGGDAIL